jgi:hypothetical protein
VSWATLIEDPQRRAVQYAQHHRYQLLKSHWLVEAGLTSNRRGPALWRQAVVDAKRRA